MLGCNHEQCFPDTTCALGYLNREECPYWVREDDETQQGQVLFNTSHIPWNSYALGTNDLAILGWRGRPIVVGLIGAPGSGKTTLLTYLYMWLLDRGEVPGWTFSGSWTFGGWESVVRYCRWIGEPPPSFPPHTSSSGRTPGLLHLSLRNDLGVLRDVLLTDAPGEWFVQWAKTPNEPSAAGARWVIQHADALLVLADSGALSDSATLAQARRDTRDLIERVGATTRGIPLIFVWTKSDVQAPTNVQKAVEKARTDFMPYSQVMRTTINDSITMVQALSRAITLGAAWRNVEPLSEPRVSSEPFLAFRGEL